MHQTRIFSLIFLLCSLVISVPFARGEDPSPSTSAPTFEEAFQKGIDAYQKKDYSAAQTAFLQALLIRPEETSTLTNLALTHYRLGQKGWALGYLREALAIDPGHREARQSYEFILEDSPPRDIPHQIEFWESLRSGFLNHFSLLTFALLSLALFLICGWVWLTYLGARKRAVRTESAPPGFPVVPSILLVFFCLALSLAAAKWKDTLDPRATVVVEKVAALTAPSEQSPSLFELFEGLEVLVRQVKGDWIQVTYPGALTGWIPKSSLLIIQRGAQ
jgi:tetratricopeptide (TPR) repeat protein